MLKDFNFYVDFFYKKRHDLCNSLNDQYVGANIPASDPFRLTPLLLAKLKLDNLRHVQDTIHSDLQVEWVSESAKNEYQDLKSVSGIGHI